MGHTLERPRYGLRGELWVDNKLMTMNKLLQRAKRARRRIVEPLLIWFKYHNGIILLREWSPWISRLKFSPLEAWRTRQSFILRIMGVLTRSISWRNHGTCYESSTRTTEHSSLNQIRWRLHGCWVSWRTEGIASIYQKGESSDETKGTQNGAIEIIKFQETQNLEENDI